jgi:membrane associated rhomboid family serine protease
MKRKFRFAPVFPSCPVTMALVFANFAVYGAAVLVALCGTAAYDDTMRTLALVPQRFMHAFALGSPGGIAWAIGSLFTALFAHAGFAHVFGNMLFLVIFGPTLEHRLGSWRYIGVYLGAGFASNFLDMYMTPGSQAACLGASAAVCGVMAGYAVRQPLSLRALLAVLYIGFTEYAALHVEAVKYIGLTFWDHMAGVMMGALFACLLTPPKVKTSPTTEAQAVAA